MFKLLGRVDISGTKAGVERCAMISSFPDGRMWQTGLKRKIPEPDSWSYETPWYQFHTDETMDDEIRDFLSVHAKIGDALAIRDAEIEYAFLTLCPIAESYEDTISGIFSCETMRSLVNMGLELQIAPAVTMPDAPYWKR